MFWRSGNSRGSGCRFAQWILRRIFRHEFCPDSRDAEVILVMQKGDLSGRHLEVRKERRCRSLEVEDTRLRRSPGAPDTVAFGWVRIKQAGGAEAHGILEVTRN